MHSMASLLLQGTVQDRVATSVASRRWLLLQKAPQRVIDQPIKGWTGPHNTGALFWLWLVWGGRSVVLGWLLSQATSSGFS